MMTLSAVYRLLPHRHTMMRFLSAQPPHAAEAAATIDILGQSYPTDEWTNVTPKIVSLVHRRLYTSEFHPVHFTKLRICDYFNQNFRKSRGTSPLFALVEGLSPVVSLAQNYDSLLVPKDHPSRNRSDTYYVNKGNVLRAHTSAHQAELVTAGLDAFLVVGDCYRRDEIDKSHYPVFHQMEGVRLFDEHELFSEGGGYKMFERGERTRDRQEMLSVDATKCVEKELKRTLEGLARGLLGADISCRWVETYFPFTHPSWELEVQTEEGEWMEMLGCGVIEQQILTNAGASTKVGWAFGIGLDRLAMRLYQIPDIRLLWSTEPSIRGQFDGHHYTDTITFKAPLSKYPPCVNDVSFWLPAASGAAEFSANDFFDLVRSVGGDCVEQVRCVDEFTNKKGRKSQCYRVVYRRADRAMTQAEANEIHREIWRAAEERLRVEIRK